MKKHFTAGGLSHEPFYQVFNKIRCRITDPKNKDYPRYGGRGLTFDWDGYMDFKKDMYQPYLDHIEKHGRKNTSIDRIDGSKGYSKDNCRWATSKEQARNRRNNRYITYKGETMILADWAIRLGVSRQTIRYRLEAGWDVENIINAPIDHKNRYNYDKRIIQSSKGLPRKKS